MEGYKKLIIVSQNRVHLQNEVHSINIYIFFVQI
jgi:hypothetical protein